MPLLVYRTLIVAAISCRLSVEDKESCKLCAVKNRCNNTCGCLNWQTTGGINTVSPVLCHYEQMLMPIADRVGQILYKKRNPLFIQKHYYAAYPVLSLLEDTWKEKKSHCVKKALLEYGEVFNKKRNSPVVS